MIHLKPTLTNSLQNKLEYFNGIGLIFENQIYLYRNDILVQYDVEDIKRVYFREERNLNYNCLSFVIALFIAFSSYNLAMVLGNFKLFGFMISGSFLLYSVLNKSYNCCILLITVNQNYVSLLVNPNSREEASKLVKLIKLKIKDNAQYLKAS